MKPTGVNRDAARLNTAMLDAITAAVSVVASCTLNTRRREARCRGAAGLLVGNYLHDCTPPRRAINTTAFIILPF